MNFCEIFSRSSPATQLKFFVVKHTPSANLHTIESKLGSYFVFVNFMIPRDMIREKKIKSFFNKSKKKRKAKPD